MNENDRTTLEQAIYEEMELTPEMIRSIRTLCGVCLCSFVESKAFKIAIVPSADRSMDTCTVCQTRRGHDWNGEKMWIYGISKKNRRETRRGHDYVVMNR